MTFDGRTSCQEFQRPATFQTIDACQTAAMIEKGRYSRRQSRRNWMQYHWNCSPAKNENIPVYHKRGR
jgi:hypothetical protein